MTIARSFDRENANRLTTAGIADYWNVGAHRFENPHARLHMIAGIVMGTRSASATGPTTVLDLGCGPGTLGRLLPGDVRYFGVDIAAEVIPTGLAPDRFAVADLNAGEEPFAGQRFDVAVVSGMFEYVRDPGAFVALLASKVRDGGHLVLSYMNRSHYRELRARLRGREFTYPDPHLNFISIPETRRLLVAGGFAIEQVRMISAGLRAVPAPEIGCRFPFNVMARQFLFVCRRQETRGMPHPGRR